jgi:uncharacterized protein YoxC
MRFDVYHHFAGPDPDEILARLDSLQSAISALTLQGHHIMATTTELLAAVTALADAFAPLPAAIDALEAAVAAIPGIPAADQANIDAAVEALRTVTAAVAAAVTDAIDGPDVVPTE